MMIKRIAKRQTSNAIRFSGVSSLRSKVYLLRGRIPTHTPFTTFLDHVEIPGGKRYVLIFTSIIRNNLAVAGDTLVFFSAVNHLAADALQSHLDCLKRGGFGVGTLFPCEA
jgi:hypothetical protein